jgi:hypothetical protein
MLRSLEAGHIRGTCLLGLRRFQENREKRILVKEIRKKARFLRRRKGRATTISVLTL